MSRGYQRCVQCVMDTSDPNISFDQNGVCNHCHKYAQAIKVDPKEKAAFERQLAAMKEIAGPYNCIIGVSGGLDSSFLMLHAVKDLKLRPLAVHVDNGWNTGLANQNIARQCQVLGVDLYTVVLDWDEFRLMQLAILDAGVPDLEAPTDLFINYSLRAAARKFGIRYILSGTNPQTEAVMGSNWSYGQRDPIYLKGLYCRYKGNKPQRLPFKNWYFSLLEIYRSRINIVKPLKFYPYTRTNAVNRCISQIGWVEYKRKHGESFITRFYQNYFLPKRFGYDKRIAHLSALILNGDIDREAAIRLLDSEATSGPETAGEISYLCKKLQISTDEFSELMKSQRKYHQDYTSMKNTLLFKLGKKIKSLIGHDNSLYRKVVNIITS